MNCPKCGAWTLVKKSEQRSRNVRYRRYECANMHRFSTSELINPPSPPKGYTAAELELDNPYNQWTTL